jgi:hypothetical protein
LAGVAVLKIRTYWPTANAVAVAATLVTKGPLAPVPIAIDEVDVIAV